MKYKCKYILFIFFLISCDPSGNLFLTNGYEYDVVLHSLYDYNNKIIERSIEFRPSITNDVVGTGHIEYSNIIAIRIETKDGEILANYNLE